MEVLYPSLDSFTVIKKALYLRDFLYSSNKLLIQNTKEDFNGNVVKKKEMFSLLVKAYLNLDYVPSNGTYQDFLVYCLGETFLRRFPQKKVELESKLKSFCSCYLIDIEQGNVLLNLLKEQRSAKV